LSEKHDTVSSVILVPNKIVIKNDQNINKNNKDNNTMGSTTSQTTTSTTEFAELFTIWIGSWDGRITVWL
jgi:hypothetical protein